MLGLWVLPWSCCLARLCVGVVAVHELGNVALANTLVSIEAAQSHSLVDNCGVCLFDQPCWVHLQ